MEYPKRIVLDDEKLKKLLQEKDGMIMEGRKVSEDIEAVQAEIDLIDKEVLAIEEKIDLADLRTEADGLTKEFNTVMSKMEDNQKKVRERMLTVVPQETRDRFEAKKKEKEDLEASIKKIALKVEKWKDKIIPRGRKLMSTYKTAEFDDYDTLRLENGEVIATLFNHLEDFKTQFRNKK